MNFTLAKCLIKRKMLPLGNISFVKSRNFKLERYYVDIRKTGA